MGWTTFWAISSQTHLITLSASLLFAASQETPFYVICLGENATFVVNGRQVIHRHQISI
jgi:hypothetical protein